ncbi:hypothetical protein SLEP1_g14913 [Rubroshorea leprosula]|uniref:ATP synthase F0 subunit 8 n=1 Tax=Rubroshorea leprosula TaxID=152421 RepID=A0AAV5IKR9_9ROSI|nr:hypothetical protein SLEP1_g14913 [Rubroshorea leprosula]
MLISLGTFALIFFRTNALLLMTAKPFYCPFKISNPKSTLNSHGAKQWCKTMEQ